MQILNRGPVLWGILLMIPAISAGSVNGQSHEDKAFWKFLVSRVNDTNIDALDEREGIRFLLGVSKNCAKVGKPELAQSYFNRAEKMAAVSENKYHHFSLFDCATQLSELTSAEKIARNAPKSSNLIDRLALERYRRGDKNALKDFPQGEWDFWSALRLGQTYVDLEEYTAADKLIQDLDIPHEENDPKGVGAIIYSNIALKLRDKGDLAGARKYIDKAMNIGGGLYYTGFNVRMRKKSIEGTLTKGLDEFAARGSAYGGHQGKELVEQVVYELIRTGFLEDARRTLLLLEESSVQAEVLGAIAGAESAKGDDEAAEKTLASIKDPYQRSLARLSTVEPLRKAGRQKRAIALFQKEFLASQSEDWNDQASGKFRKLAGLCGTLRRTKEARDLLERPVESRRKATALSQIIRGYALTIKPLKTN